MPYRTSFILLESIDELPLFFYSFFECNNERRDFVLANKTGGMSGPAIKPVAVRMVYQVANAVDVPIIGMGGISTAEDALEFIMAGATAVSVGTANFINPATTLEVVDGIKTYMERHQINDINELIGCVK